MWFLMATSIINDSSYNIFTITRLLCYYKIGEYVLRYIIILLFRLAC